MNVGDKVFLVRYYSWGSRDAFREGVVSKITPSGLIDVKVRGLTTRFDKNGRERATYNGERIDTEMSFEERLSHQAMLGRIDIAAVALRVVTTEERRRYNTKEELIEEVERLYKLLAEANLLVQGV
jgi:hypothetical protein